MRLLAYARLCTSNHTRCQQLLMVTEKAYAYSIADIVIILREGIQTVGGVIIVMCIN